MGRDVGIDSGHEVTAKYEVWGCYRDSGEPEKVAAGSLDFCRGYVTAIRERMYQDYAWVVDPSIDRPAPLEPPGTG